jgi:hypothetical protein
LLCSLVLLSIRNCWLVVIFTSNTHWVKFEYWYILFTCKAINDLFIWCYPFYQQNNELSVNLKPFLPPKQQIIYYFLLTFFFNKHSNKLYVNLNSSFLQAKQWIIC